MCGRFWCRWFFISLFVYLMQDINAKVVDVVNCYLRSAVHFLKLFGHCLLHKLNNLQLAFDFKHLCNFDFVDLLKRILECEKFNKFAMDLLRIGGVWDIEFHELSNALRLVYYLSWFELCFHYREWEQGLSSEYSHGSNEASYTNHESEDRFRVILIDSDYNLIVVSHKNKTICCIHTKLANMVNHRCKLFYV